MRGVTFSEFGGGKNVDMFVQAPIAKPQSPMKEAINTAIKIRNTFSKDLYVWCDYSVQHIYSQIAMIAHQLISSKCLLSGLTLFLFSVGAFANGDPASFLKFSTDFDAKCVTRGGVMIYISNTHSSGKIKVL